MFIVGVIIQICSGHVWQQFAVGRFVGGLGVGALSAAVPMVSALQPLFFTLIIICTVSSRGCSLSDPWYFDVRIVRFGCIHD